MDTIELWGTSAPRWIRRGARAWAWTGEDFVEVPPEVAAELARLGDDSPAIVALHERVRAELGAGSSPHLQTKKPAGRQAGG